MKKSLIPELNSRMEEMLESAKDDLNHFRKELGKDMVNVQDRYVRLRKELIEAIRQIRSMIDDSKDLGSDVVETLQAKLASLESSLEKGANRLEKTELVKELTLLKEGMTDLVNYLGTLDFYDLTFSRIYDRFYRFKIKFAILKLKLQLGALQVKDVYLDTRFDMKKKANTLRTRAVRAELSAEKKWRAFQHEMSEAYEHLSKAFTSK